MRPPYLKPDSCGTMISIGTIAQGEHQHQLTTELLSKDVKRVDQSFHMAEGKRLSVPESVSSMFRAPDDVMQMYNDLSARTVIVKFHDENKNEIEREENLDLREALESEVVTVLSYFIGEQNKRDAEILLSNQERAVRMWSLQQQKRTEAAMKRKVQYTSDSITTPHTPLILPIAHLDTFATIPSESFSSVEIQDSTEILESSGDGRKPAGFKVKAYQSSKCTPLQRLWKVPAPRNRIRMSLSLDQDLKSVLHLDSNNEWVRSSVRIEEENATSSNSSGLQDSQTAVNVVETHRTPTPSFLCDKVSEFADSLDSAINVVNAHSKLKKPAASSSVAVLPDSTRVPVLAVPFVPALPLSFTWINIAANVRTDDDTVLRSLPYFGDEDVTGVDMSDFDKVPAEYEAPASGEAEEFTIVYMLDKYRKANGFIRPEVYSSLSNTLGITVSEVSKAYQRVTEGPYYMAIREANNPVFQLKTLNPGQVDNDTPLLMLYGMEPASVSVESTKNGVGLGIYNSSDYAKVMENYRALFCRRCYTYNCNTHSINQPLPEVRVDPSPPFPCPFQGLELPTDYIRSKNNFKTYSAPHSSLQSSSQSVSFTPPLPSCSDPLADLTRLGSMGPPRKPVSSEKKKALCATDLEMQRFLDNRKPLDPTVIESIPSKLYSGMLKNESGEKDRAPPLTDVEKTLITKMYGMYCRGVSTSSSSSSSSSGIDEQKRTETLKIIARLLGTRSVEEIDEFLRNDASVSADDMQQSMSPKKPVKISVLNKNQKQREFVACSHEGPCTRANCWCVQNEGFCEKYCCCGVDCKHKFPGCNCRRGGCTTKACPCVAANRSCDPDLCGVCGASIPAALVPRVEAHFNDVKSGRISVPGLEPADCKLCANTVFIHKRSGKRLLMAPSAIDGWGAYIEKSAERHDFICEYVGEVISQDEADRRGKVYDKINLSYLFTMNEDQAVDASRKGNKAKFLNHSETPNCYTRIIQVNGDHRIGMYADRHISAGEELSFDYGYLDEIAPVWSKRRKIRQAAGENARESNSKHQRKP